MSQPGKPLYGIEHSNDGLITFPGGLPIVDEDGVLVGAIGVSGSTVENDHAVAEAGVKVLGVSELPAHPWRQVSLGRERQARGRIADCLEFQRRL